jgi:epoxyqueuosine reductase
MTIEKNEIEDILNVSDIDKTGIVRLEDWKDTPVYEKAGELLPGAKSVIALALEVLPETIKFLAPKRTVGELRTNDFYNRNIELVNGRLDWETYKMVKRLHRYGYKGLSLTASGAPFDLRFIEPALPYKKAAGLAGMGTIGWHSMLLTPEYGPRVRLACVVTDAPLEPTVATDMSDPCTKCGGACIKICPVKAIKQPEAGGDNNVDKYACSNYLAAAGGCSQCLKVCPAGKP